jgi:hypothetical protein
LYASGGHFVIELEGSIAICRMWSRPDVDREEGARFDLAEVDAFKRLVAEPVAVAAASVLEMTRAPASWGPVTQSCLERIVAMFESAGRRVAVVVSADPLQRAQMEHIAQTYAPVYGRLFVDLERAKAWASGDPPSSPDAGSDGSSPIA